MTDTQEADMNPGVVLVGPLPPPFHGVATATMAIMQSALLNGRFDIALLDTADRRELSNMGQFDFANISLGLRHAWQLLGIIRKRRPKLMHLTLSQNNGGFLRDTVFVVCARLSGVRVVAHLRGSRYVDFANSRGMFMRAVVRRTFAACSRVVVLGEGMRVMGQTLAPAAPIDVIPNGCADFVGLRLTARTSGSSPVRLCFLSNLRQAKGVRLALEASARLKDAGHDIVLVLAGEWADEAEESRARAFVRERDLASVIELRGLVTGDAKTDLFLSSDVFLLPSYAEGHPWAIIEAMCAGLPVVATRTGAIPETVEDGVTGFVIPVDDVDALTDRLARLVSDSGLRERMGKDGRSAYERLLTVERSHRLLAQCWETAISAPAEAT